MLMMVMSIHPVLLMMLIDYIETRMIDCISSIKALTASNHLMLNPHKDRDPVVEHAQDKISDQPSTFYG